MVDHKAITDAERHEPKGISTAAINTVYIANGAGSGSWSNPFSAVKNANLVPLTVSIPDISAPDSAFVVTPIAGKITNVYVTIHNAITVANSIVTMKINGVAVGGLSITITQAGSVAGSKFTGTATSTNTVAAGDLIEVITDGGATTTAVATVTILLNTA